jgi:hypothetical protein
MGPELEARMPLAPPAMAKLLRQTSSHSTMLLVDGEPLNTSL